MGKITEPATDPSGNETHPSFGLAQIHRVSAHPPHRLFDSSLGHTHYITLEIKQAIRQRNLARDWIYAASGPPLIEIEMSYSQWGNLISSAGQGSGTPVTIHMLNGQTVPEALHESRLAITAAEVSKASTKAMQDVKTAVDSVLEAFDRRAGRRDMSAVLSRLQHTVGNLPANMQFAADSLTEHAEEVVAKARADMEAAATATGHRELPGQPYTETIELESS